MIEKIGQKAVLFFIALLPWSVIISVFGSEQLHMGLFRFWKEIVMGIIFVLFCIDSNRKKKLTYDGIDIAILLYILWLITVSIFHSVPVV